MDLGWKILIPIALGWFLLLAALREFSPEGDALDSARVVIVSFVVALIATALFVAALRVSARNRQAGLSGPDPEGLGAVATSARKGVTT
jgi:NADH-quinone oxidoreductase subunit H